MFTTKDMPYRDIIWNIQTRNISQR